MGQYPPVMSAYTVSASGRARLIAPFAVGLAHFVVAAGSLALTRWSNGLASVWLPNAILLAYLLLSRRRNWPPALAAVFLSGTLANWLGGVPFGVAALFGATNIFEPLATIALMGAGKRIVDLERLGDLLRFAVGVALACAISATAAAGAMASVMGFDFRVAWISWFDSSGLGLLIATPILMVGYNAWREGKTTRRDLAEGAAALALVLVASLLVAQSRWPLLFLLQPPVLLATFRMRALGAAAATLILAVVGTIAMILHTGAPIFAVLPFAERMAVLQGFLGVTILTAMPIAALLAERDRFSRRLADREMQFRSVVDAVSDVIFQSDAEGRWTYLNPAWETLTGYPVAEVLGTPVMNHVVEEDRAPFLERLRGLNAGLFATMRHQFRFVTASGDQRWGEVQISRLNGPDGEAIGSAGIIVDISDRLALAALSEDARRRAEQEAQAALMLAATDELTGVASRRAFLAMLDQLLAQAEPLAVALFDIDHFKLVNDRHGHAIGDDVLRRIAAIAENCVRDGDMVGRLGGEEFAVLMPGSSLNQAAAVGERLRKACAEAFHPPGMMVTISVGVAAANAASTSATLLRDADAALYRAKYEGRNCLRMAA
jgi:diguanylate cyclase (GGDEF)-like protein/PAS domain S-box-containing protein